MASPSAGDIPQAPGAGTVSSANASDDRFAFFRMGKPPMRLLTVSDAKDLLADVAGGVDSITQTVDYDDFTDGGSTVGTLTMTDYIPAGSIMLGTKVLVSAGFAGDTSATLTIGDGSDVDRYNTGTPSVFSDAATGIETGIPSGSKLQLAAVQPVLTVTTNADFTSVSAGTMAVTVYFIRTTT